MNTDVVLNLEREINEEKVRKDKQRFSQLLADDFEEIGKSGRRYNKQQIIDSLQQPHINFDARDYCLAELSKDCLLVKYVTELEGEITYRCSIWVNTNNQWLLKYHQGTVAHS